MYNVYLSPHLDDAALSCGGLMAIQRTRGEHVQVINFFAGVPDLEEEQFSAYAQKQHSKWDLKPKEAVLARRREDQQVLASLGVNIENWDYYDAIYRAVDNQFLYTDHQEVFGSIHPAEYSLLHLLTERLERVYQGVPSAVFYAPLRIGGHVDHLVVRECAIKLHGQGVGVVFYEDFPYVAKEDWMDEPTTAEKAITELPFPVESEPICIDAEAKIKALLDYKSQLRSLFGDRPAIGLAHVLYTYGAKIAQKAAFDEQVYCEQYWRPG